MDVNALALTCMSYSLCLCFGKRKCLYERMFGRIHVILCEICGLIVHNIISQMFQSRGVLVEKPSSDIQLQY